MSIATRNCIFGKAILRRSIVETVSLVSAIVGKEIEELQFFQR